MQNLIPFTRGSWKHVLDAGGSLGRTVFVLGMHRSGTSSLTGCLEECGLALGDVNRAAPHNQKGNQENRRVMELHDDLLRYNGGSWDRPPRRLSWSDEHRRRRDELLAEYRGLPVFGIKDPRLLVTLDLWLDAGLEASFVGTFRHPVAVVDSLGKRPGLPVERPLELWVDYNRRLLRRRAELDFELVSFDLPPREYLSSVMRVARGLDLEPPPDPGGFRFFEAGLRRNVPTHDALPSEVAELYDELRRLAV